MAAKRKTTQKPTSAPKKKASAPARSARRKPAAPPRLTPDQRRKLFKVPPEYAELISNVIETWTSSGKELRVTNRTPAKLKSLLRIARAAADREEKLRRQYEAKLGALLDARLLAQHEAWRALLDLYAAIRAARSNEGLQEAFAFLGEHFARNARKPDTPADPAPAA